MVKKISFKIDNEEFSVQKSINGKDFYYLRVNFHHYGFFGREIVKGKSNSLIPNLVEEFNNNLYLYKLAHKKMNNIKAFI